MDQYDDSNERMELLLIEHLLKRADLAIDAMLDVEYGIQAFPEFAESLAMSNVLYVMTQSRDKITGLHNQLKEKYDR